MQLKNLFFSYSRSDGAAFAVRLAVDLQKEGFNVWIDQQDIRAGSEWDLEIEKALETCDCLLFIETERSVVSNNVLDEVYYALEQNKRVIPLILVDSKTPFRLKRLQHIDFSVNYERGLAHLVQELNGITTHTAAPPATAPVSQTTPRQPMANKKFTILLAGIAGMLILAFIGYNFFSKKKETAIIADSTQVTVTDTLRAETDTLALATSNMTVDNIPAEVASKLPVKNATGRKPAIREPKLNPERTPTRPLTATVDNAATIDGVLLPENFAGTWQLSGVAAPARGHQGYLNIEAVGENKIKVLSTFQFSFVRANDTAYFEVFNGFAGCTSCTINKEITIVDNDVAFGAQIYKILRTDVAGEGKAGDTVMTVGPNKSINATMTLQLINMKSANIRVRRSTAVPMSYGMVIPPFDYTFRFTRKDF